MFSTQYELVRITFSHSKKQLSLIWNSVVFILKLYRITVTYTNLCFDSRQNRTGSTVKTELHPKH